jgi:hypothetical protein
MIRKVSADDLSKPFSLDRYGFVHSPLQLLFDRSQPCPHPISARLPFKLEGAPAGSATDMSKTKKVERSRLSKTTAFSIFSRKAAEFNQPGLIRMQRKRELFQPLPHIFQEPFRVSFVLKAHDKSSRPGELHPQALTDSGLERLRSSGSYRPVAARRSNGQ